MWEYILRLNKKEDITVFFTTHYMEEAEKIAQRIAIIDHGKIVSEGTSSQLKSRTKSKSLEDAFLALTGHQIRAEKFEAVDNLRMHRRMWGGGRRG